MPRAITRSNHGLFTWVDQAWGTRMSLVHEAHSQLQGNEWEISLGPYRTIALVEALLRLYLCLILSFLRLSTEETTMYGQKKVPNIYIGLGLNTSNLSAVCYRFQLAGLPNDVRPLHGQKLLGRSVLVTEGPDKHFLVRSQNLHWAIDRLSAWPLMLGGWKRVE